MLAARGQYAEAEQAYRDLLAARERVLGPKHPSTRTTQDSPAELEKATKPPPETARIKNSLSFHYRSTERMCRLPRESASATHEKQGRSLSFAFSWPAAAGQSSRPRLGPGVPACGPKTGAGAPRQARQARRMQGNSAVRRIAGRPLTSPAVPRAGISGAPGG
jgi:Tetratricopeptide repeat